MSFLFRFKSVQYSNNSYMFSCIKNMQVTFVEKTQLKIICFPNYKHWYLIHTLSDKAFKGTVVNWALPSLHGNKTNIPFNKWKLPKMDPLTRLQIFRPSMFGGTLEEVLDIQKVNIIIDNILQECDFLSLPIMFIQQMEVN